MKRQRLGSLCVLAALAVVPLHAAEVNPVWEIESPQGGAGDIAFDFNTGLAVATNGVVIRYGGAVVTADRASLNQQTGEVRAEGRVVLTRDGQVWRSERLGYNFKTAQIQAESFRIGQTPFFSAGRSLEAGVTSQVYTATQAYITTDDVAEPGFRIRSQRLTIAPDRYLEARHATVYLGNVPVFYFPYYRRSLDRHPNHFDYTPGYRSAFGPYLLTTYNSYWSERLSTHLHLDYRLERGFGVGPDIRYDLGRAGQGAASYYYLKDDEPGLDSAGAPINEDRQRLWFSHRATLRTNLTANVVVRYQSDEFVIRDFFEAEYQANTQPSSFLELNQLWPDFSLNLLAQPQINDFFETVERLPDLRLSAFRQQLGPTPLFYEGESSIGYFRRATNASPEIEAWRADTFHQIVLPWTFFGWLNVTPRAGGRFTHYGEADGFGTTTQAADRWVFNTGAEVSLKASRLWPGVRNRFFQIDGLRHIIEPSVNYVYVPTPNKEPGELPQFDSELPGLRLPAIEFPDFNSIDSIDRQDVLRFVLRNKLHTKRGGAVDPLADWAVYTDWRLNPGSGQSTFADLFSDLDLRLNSWLRLGSGVRYDLAGNRWREADHIATIDPGGVWSLSAEHRYLRDDPVLGPGNNLVLGSVLYRLNENWAARASLRFEARDGTLEEQYYTLYRDLRSWTGALTFRIRDNRDGRTDFTVALTLSLKAYPRFGVGKDRDQPSRLVDG
jgi:LPS-assembly protein